MNEKATVAELAALNCTVVEFVQTAVSFWIPMGINPAPDEGGNVMGVSGGGLATSIAVFAVGAVLRFAETVNTIQHGFNLHTLGVILMIVGAAGAVLSFIGMAMATTGGHRTVVDDGRGNVVRREDTYS